MNKYYLSYSSNIVQANFAESGPNLEVKPIRLISSQSGSNTYR